MIQDETNSITGVEPQGEAVPEGTEAPVPTVEEPQYSVPEQSEPPQEPPQPQEPFQEAPQFPQGTAGYGEYPVYPPHMGYGQPAPPEQQPYAQPQQVYAAPQQAYYQPQYYQPAPNPNQGYGVPGGYGPQTAPYQQQAVQPGYPQNQPYSGAYYPPQPQPVYPYGGQPFPPKKKMSVGLKVFIWIASILAGLAILGCAAYFAYSVVNSVPQLPDYNYGGGNPPFFFQQPEDGQDDDTPRFDDGVTPPDDEEGDADLPKVDVVPNTEGITIEKKPEGQEMTTQEVYNKVVKSTVTVAASLERNGQEGTSTGTGIIATSDGYIITNAHVVLNSKSTTVKITTYDGQEYDAVVVGTDRTSDVAILKTNDHNFTPAEFGDAEELAIGDSVVAIGNPGGAKFSGSMTGGYISGLHREVGKYSENGMTYIQTDAAINPGNSGGPLVNLYGQVVGINSSKIISDGYEGMGFAIPVSSAKDIIDQLLAGGYVKGRVRLGIVGQEINEAAAAFSGVPQGFRIIEIGEESAFSGTDAQVGDIITAIDDETVTSLSDISNLLLRYAPGDTVTVTLYRQGQGSTEVQATLLEDKGETQK